MEEKEIKLESEGLEQKINVQAENVVINEIGDYNQLSNKPQINDVELSGNKTLDDLGIQAKGDYLTKNIADETYQAKGNYATKDELPTKTSELENDSGFITELPIATTDVLGGVKIGDGLSIDSTGLLSATGGSGAGIPELIGTQEEPINLDSDFEAGIYLISGYIIYNKATINSTNKLLFFVNYARFDYNNPYLNKIKYFYDNSSSFGVEGFRLHYASSSTWTTVYLTPGTTLSESAVYDQKNRGSYVTVTAAYNYYGKKSELTTTDKTTLVAAINELAAKVAALEEGE